MWKHCVCVCALLVVYTSGRLLKPVVEDKNSDQINIAPPVLVNLNSSKDVEAFVDNGDLNKLLDKLGLTTDALSNPLSAKMVLKMLKMQLLDDKANAKIVKKDNFLGLPSRLTFDKFQFARIRVNKRWTTIYFDFPLQDPIVTIGPAKASFGSSKPWEVQIDNVKNSSFDIRWVDHCDDSSSHWYNTEVSYLAVSRGRYLVGSTNKLIEAGTALISEATVVSFLAPFAEVPSVTATRQNNEDVYKSGRGTRLLSITKSTFTVGLQEKDSNVLIEDSQGRFEMGFIALEQGLTSLPLDATVNLNIIARNTSASYTEAPNFIEYPEAGFMQEPVLVATINRPSNTSADLFRLSDQNLVTEPLKDKLKVVIREHVNNGCTPVVEGPANHIVSFIALGNVPLA